MGTNELAVAARDGYQLAATVYTAAEPRGVVVLNGATAVPHKFYRRFAEALARGGLTTVTYDFRGIGASKPPSLRGFTADMTDWALKDMAGVIDWALAEFETDSVSVVGHSFGGQVAGLMDMPDRIDRMATFCSQSGHWRHQGGIERYLVGLHVYLTLPLLSRAVGYAPWSRFSSAEDLPKGVALQWSSWCRDRRYLFSDDSLPLDRYDDFTAPVLAYSFDDDDWGTERSVDILMGHYPNVERRHVYPADAGIDRIGHMGFFKESSAALWPEVIEWLLP